MSTATAKGAIAPHPVSAPDFTPIPQLHELQLKRLQAIVMRAWQHVKLFRARMDELGLAPQDIRALEDIAKLPFTMKSDLRDNYPFGLLASPIEEIVRFHASSGTTGKPIVVAYTAEDLEVWTSVMARAFSRGGLGRGDIFQNTHGYGLFTGGIGFHYGVERLGAAVIPISGGNTDRQIMIMKDFGVTAMSGTPSYIVHIAERAAELGVDIRKLPLRVGFFGAEPWTESMRKHIQDELGIEAFDMYGLSEMTGPGVGCECQMHNGLHIAEDHFYPEIIGLESGEPVPDGMEGELVLTTLSKQAMPMIRYRTHDITMILPGACECGRTLRRIQRIGRRSNDMLIIRGVNLFPSQVESALLKVEGTLPHYQIILTREQGLDQMEVQVEVTPNVFNGEIVELRGLQKKLQHACHNVLGLNVKVSLVEPRSIQRSEGKAKRVIDRRTS